MPTGCRGVMCSNLTALENLIVTDSADPVLAGQRR
jgi:hypothetical protein